MTRQWLRVGSWVLAVSVVLLTPVLGLAEPSSPGKQVRFKVSLTVTGTYQHTGPKAIPQGATSLTVKQSVDNSYSAEYVVVPNLIQAGLQKTNPMDPASQQEMADYNAKVAARNDRIYHSADNLRKPGMGGSARSGGMTPGMMDMGRMQEMQQKMMACGNDQSCKQRMAMEMMSQQRSPTPSSGPGAQVQADIQAISEACIKKGNQMGSKGYEDCMNAEGEKRSTVKRSAADNEAEIPELPDRYLLYSNLIAEKKGEKFMDCQYKAHYKVNESGTYGTVGDISGKYDETSGTLKGEGDFKQKPELIRFNMTPCSQAEAVFDANTNLFWGGFISMEAPELAETGGTYFFGSSKADQRTIEGWAKSALQGVPASGTKTQKFGYQTATLTWSITRE